MTTDQIARLQALPYPSAAMRRYCAAVTTFLEEDQPGGWKAPAGRINAKDQRQG
jgi:hypothetical protein